MSFTDVPIVLGPEGSDTPGNILYALALIRTTDKFQYRLDVRMWSNRVRSFARAGDTRAKGVAGSLGHVLYAKMDVTYRKVLDSAIASGKLKLDNEDETPLTDNEHRQSVQQILDLVAKDSDIDRVRRLVNLSQKVYNCKRGDDESYDAFADRFYAVAQTYLNQCHAKGSDHESQNFAMMLLENANLTTSTNNKIVTYLVAHAMERAEHEEIKFNAEIYKSLVENATNLRDRATLLDRATVIEDENDENDEHIQKLKGISESNLEIITAMKKKETQGDSERMKCKISLEKAVSALKDIKTEADLTSSKADATSALDNDTKMAKTKKIGVMMNHIMKGEYRKTFHQNDHPNRSRWGNSRWNFRASNNRHKPSPRNCDYNDEFTNSEYGEHQNKTRKHVTERLGKRGDDSFARKRHVRFGTTSRHEDSKKRKYKSVSDDESGDEQDFRI